MKTIRNSFITHQDATNQTLKRTMLDIHILVALILSFWTAETDGSDSELTIVGTWSSKSNQVFTGPGFYDPVDELLIEPSLPGISYSFTDDGWFEEAIYQVTGNPRNTTCPSAVLIYQHGTYEILNNGSLVLTPIEVDGRQLLSEPCVDKGVSTYTRYNQTEIFKSYLVSLDDYHGMYKLQLYAWDGAPSQPLYLAYRPPMMLPTETLNPTASGSSEDSSSSTNNKKSLRSLVKRNLELRHKTNAKKVYSGFFNSDAFWYICTSLLGVGSFAFILS